MTRKYTLQYTTSAARMTYFVWFEESGLFLRPLKCAPTNKPWGKSDIDLQGSPFGSHNTVETQINAKLDHDYNINYIMQRVFYYVIN